MFTLSGRPMPGVVPDQLPEEDPARHRPVQGHGGGELDLLDRQLPAVVGVLVGTGERVREAGQPLAGEPVDLLVGQPVADLLHGGRVADGAERVVQGGEADPGPGALPHGIFMPVEVDLPGIGEVAAEFHVERAEIGVEPVEIPVIDHRLLLAQPRIPLAGHRVPALPGPPHPGLLLGHPGEQDLLSAIMAGQVPPGDLVLALPLGEPDQVQPADVDVVADVRGEPLGHRAHQRRGHELVPPVVAEKPVNALPVLQPRLPEGQQHPVDAADLQPHVTGQDLRGGTR
jgi:hypothetical protein